MTDLQIELFDGIDHWLPHQLTDMLLTRLAGFEQSLP